VVYCPLPTAIIQGTQKSDEDQMPILTPSELKNLAKRVVDLEKESMYGDEESEDQRLSMIERLMIEESRRLNPQ
jgi:hypothetical protein